MSDIVTLNGYKIKDEKAVRTYDTVALLKADTKLKVGQHVKTRGYYLINDGGSAEYYITDNQSNTKYQEELNNGLYATLISDSFINIKQLGAKGDGETDDSPIIRKAIAYLKILGGGTLYLPIGTYYVNSGDPRGMNTGESFSKEDYYTCFELIDNLNVIGDGDNSVILYNSNRIGYNTQTSRGDVGAIFANFRVNGTENYHVRGKLKFENFKLIYTDLEEGEKDNRDYIDGQLVRVNSPSFEQDYNDIFIFNNISIENATGQQIISVCGSKEVSCNNINIRNVGKINNSANTDFSAFYINAKICNIKNCSVTSDLPSSGTAYELHSSNTNLINCYAENISSFSNVVGNVLGYDSNYLITNNIVRNVINFVNIWVYDNRKIKNLTINNNDVLLRYNDAVTTESILSIRNDIGGFTSSTKPIDFIDFYNNKIETNITDSVDVDNRTYDNSAIVLHNIKKINISNNRFNNFRRGLIWVTENTTARLEEIFINNNIIRNVGLLVPTSTMTRAIYIILPPLYLTNDVKKIIEINNNTIDLLSRDSSSSYGIYVNVRHSGVDTNTRLVIQNNRILANNEVRIYAKGSDGTMPNSILFNHEYNNPLTNMLSALQGNDSALGNFIINSSISGSLNDYLAKCEYIGSEKYRTIGYSNASPTTGGYHQKGSIILNDSPSFTSESPYCWICTTAGNPGTWTGYNPSN